MSQDASAKRAVPKKRVLISAVIGTIVLLIVFALVALIITPVKYDIAVGEVAPSTITSSRDITDEISTQALRKEASEAVADIYAQDAGVSAQAEESISRYYAAAAQQAAAMQDEYVSQFVKNNGYGMTQESYRSIFEPAEVDWDSFLTTAMRQKVRAALEDDTMPSAAIFALASMDSDQINGMAQTVKNTAADILSQGIMTEQLTSAQNDAEGILRQNYADPGTLYLAYYPVEKFLKPNMVFDEAGTQQAREAAADKVQPIIYKQNQTVVLAGEVVTEQQMAVLTALGVVGSDGVDYSLYAGMLLLLTLVFAVYGMYLYQFESKVLADTRKLLVLASIVVVIAAISVPLARLDSRIVPALFGTMLACVLVSQKSALAFNVFLSVIAGIICSWNSGLLSETMTRTMMVTLIGGSVSVFSLYKPGHRGALIFAGLLSGLAGVAVTTLFGVVGTAGVKLESLLNDGVFALGSGLLSGMLAIGTLPIWEAVFRVSTPAKLLELSNPNHPLLKRMSIEAPGTYHHSILTANLAEAGADAVGANALLCRVGAYYHDVGKLKNPRFFKENQRGENPHDLMDPRESAKIITAHLNYGLDMAQKYKLPRDVQKIIAQHHGDGVVPYFLHKALEAGMEPVEEQFRYRGTKPSSKEAAIVMLADTVEAAVRSMGDPDREQVKDMVEKLIHARFTDGQMDDSPLNRRDMSTLGKAFLSVYDGALHERVKYPGQE